MMSKNESTKAKLSIISFGIGIGVAEGLYMLLFAWAGKLFDYGLPLIQQLATVMHGYAPSFMGGIIGGIWGFVDGFIFGLIAALVYNLCFCCRCGKTSENKELNK